jgi:hypothetical protein
LGTGAACARWSQVPVVVGAAMGYFNWWSVLWLVCRHCFSGLAQQTSFPLIQTFFQLISKDQFEKYKI